MSTEQREILQHLPGYRLIRELGVGGQARVHLAEQTSIQRRVAIKTLLPDVAADPNLADQFLQEARTISKLSHAHIIQVYDFGQKNGIYYMVMEYLPGGDLKRWIQSGMEPEEAIQVLGQIAQALQYAHDHGVIHRDIKPDNIMFREDNSAVLMDFGIAQRRKPRGGTVTEEGGIFGTPSYMSPEQVLGQEIDGRSDLYSLGILFFEMLTQRLPYWDEDLAALAMKHARDPIPRLPQEFAQYQGFFERMVAKDPEERFQTGREIGKICQEILAGTYEFAPVERVSPAQLEAVLSAASETVPMKAGKAGTIPREIASFLQDVHPLLDEGWERKIMAIFRQLSEEKRRYIYHQFLIPKGIRFDQKKTAFYFLGMPTVSAVYKTLKNSNLKQIGRRLQQAEESLRQTRDLRTFGDLVESSLGLLEDFDCRDNQIAQKERNALQTAYLNDLILLIRSATFDPLEGDLRTLTTEEVVTFLLQVYIRQQLMGYRFRTLDPWDLVQDEHPFIRTVLAKEARIRQCEIVRTNRYLFLIAPVRDIQQNPYSIRRFLHEDRGPGGIYIWVHGVSVPLSGLSSPKTQERVRREIARMVSLERQLSREILEVIEGMGRTYVKNLGPLLRESITADGIRLEQAIERRLFEYERLLTNAVLVKFTKAIRKLAKRPDDFEYLVSNTRRLLIELASDARDFNTQTAISWSQKAEDFDLRVLAYLRLLEKRKAIGFSTSQDRARNPLQDPLRPLRDCRHLVKDYRLKFNALEKRLKQTIHQQSRREESAFYRVLSFFLRFGRKPVMPEQVEQEIRDTKQKCLVDLIRIFKRYSKVTVYLELEGLIPVDEGRRHYALPSGEDGLARLPALVRLPEDKADLDLDAVGEYLDFDVLSALPNFEPGAD